MDFQSEINHPAYGCACTVDPNLCWCKNILENVKQSAARFACILACSLFSARK